MCVCLCVCVFAEEGMNVVSRASRALNGLTQDSKETVNDINEAVKLLNGGLQGSVTGVLAQLTRAQNSVQDSALDFGICQGVTMEDLVHDESAKETEVGKSNDDLLLFLRLQLSKIKKYNLYIECTGDRMQFARDSMNYIVEQIGDAYVQLKHDGDFGGQLDQELSNWVRTSFAAVFSSIVVDQIRTCNMAIGKTGGLRYSKDLGRVLLDKNLQRRWKHFKHIVGTDHFMRGVNIANVAQDAAHKLCRNLGYEDSDGEGGGRTNRDGKPRDSIGIVAALVSPIFDELANLYFGKVKSIAAFVADMVRQESWDVVETEFRSLGDMLPTVGTAVASGEGFSKDRAAAATSLSYYQEQHQRLLKKRASLGHVDAPGGNTGELAELLHALKRIEIEKQVLKKHTMDPETSEASAPNTADRMVQSDSHSRVGSAGGATVERPTATRTESIASAAVFYELSKQMFLLLCKFQENEGVVRAACGDGIVEKMAQAWADVAVAYIAVVQEQESTIEGQSNEVSKHFGVIMSAHFVAASVSELESSLKRHQAVLAESRREEGDGNDGRSKPLSISTAVYRQEEMFRAHRANRMGKDISHELCSYHLVFDLITYGSMPDATFASDESGERAEWFKRNRFQEATPSALLLSSLEWLACVTKLIDSALPQSREQIIARALLITFEKIACHESWEFYVPSADDHLERVQSRLMLDLHLLLYAGMLGGGGAANTLDEVTALSKSERVRSIEIPPFLANAAKTVFEKCKAVHSGEFFFSDRPAHWFYVLASVYKCEECDDL